VPVAKHAASKTHPKDILIMAQKSHLQNNVSPLGNLQLENTSGGCTYIEF